MLSYKQKVLFVFGFMFLACLIIFWDMLGSGAFRRAVTLTGIYSICRPDHYEVVCFLDADSKHGGMFCMPLSAVGGTCRK